MSLPTITVKVEDDGWGYELRLHQPSTTTRDVARQIGLSEGLASMLLSAWLPWLREIAKIAARKDAEDYQRERHLEGV